ncbi:MAG: DNA polymerase III subunit delta [Bdellovibrionales bacterium]|nr:DNA polymerase III subunit delta [Bdellovibrionales bacterium]
MAQLTPNQVLTQLSQGRVLPVYYFYGDEMYLVQTLLAELQKVCLGEGPSDFNLDVFYYTETSAQHIIDTAETLPMFSPKRLVVVRQISELKAKDQDQLMQLIEKPIDTTCVVLVGKKMDARKKFFKTLIGQNAVVKFDPPSMSDVPSWVQKIAKEKGLTIDREAQDALIQMVGNSLTDIENEMQKLRQFVGDQASVKLSDVKTVVSKHRMESVFDLTKSIAEQDLPRSLFFLANLLEQGENELGILALIARHVRILNLVKEGIKEGVTASQLAVRAGVPPYFINQYIGQARYWSEERLEHLHMALLLTDRALKSSPVSTSIWLENFVLKSCQPEL